MACDAGLWKLEGLAEYDARRPTPTGTNLLGLVIHLASVGDCPFGADLRAAVAGPSRADRHGRTAYGVPMSRIVTDQQGRPVSAVVAIVVAILSGGYMLPWAIAALRGNANTWRVFWVNLLLGWTVIGWIVALVMSIREHRILGIR